MHGIYVSGVLRTMPLTEVWRYLLAMENLPIIKISIYSIIPYMASYIANMHIATIICMDDMPTDQDYIMKL